MMFTCRSPVRHLLQRPAVFCHVEVFAIGQRKHAKIKTLPCVWNCSKILQHHKFSMTARHQFIFRTECVASSRFVHSSPSDVVKDLYRSQSFRVVYRLPYIQGLRLLSRLKIIQTALTVGMIPLCSAMYASGSMGLDSVVKSMGIASFASIMLIVMSEMFRKSVGLISISDDECIVRISHMNFWGRRVDEYFELTDFVPLADISESGNDIFVKVRVYSDFKKHYYLFLKHGHIEDIEVLTKIFGSLSL